MRKLRFGEGMSLGQRTNKWKGQASDPSLPSIRSHALNTTLRTGSSLQPPWQPLVAFWIELPPVLKRRGLRGVMPFLLSACHWPALCYALIPSCDSHNNRLTRHHDYRHHFTFAALRLERLRNSSGTIRPTKGCSRNADPVPNTFCF